MNLLFIKRLSLQSMVFILTEYLLKYNVIEQLLEIRACLLET